jgi:ketosteroid isomerase-like protein
MAERIGLSALLKSDADPVDSPAGRRMAKNAVLQYFRAVAAGDRTALGAILTDDAIYEIPLSESGSTESGQYRRFEGRAAVVEFWMATLKAGVKSLGSSDVELSITPDGSRLFIEQRGDMVMPDGTPYKNRYVFRFSIVDGKVNHVREYLNPITAAYVFHRKIANQFLLESL